MESRWRCFQGLAVVLALSGCTVGPHLRISSQPQGAYLSNLESGEGYGMAPADVWFSDEYLQQHTSADGCYLLDGIEAHWVSGATTTLTGIRYCKDDGQDRDITLSRPAGYPGLAKDLQMELELRKSQARERQAAAESAAAYAVMQQADAQRQASEAYLRQREYERREQRERHEREQQPKVQPPKVEQVEQQPRGAQRAEELNARTERQQRAESERHGREGLKAAAAPDKADPAPAAPAANPDQ